MKRSRVTSFANDAFSASFSIAAPPYLITTVFSKKARMYGNASTSVFALRISSSMATARG